MDFYKCNTKSVCIFRITLALPKPDPACPWRRRRGCLAMRSASRAAWPARNCCSWESRLSAAMPYLYNKEAPRCRRAPTLFHSSAPAATCSEAPRSTRSPNRFIFLGFRVVLPVALHSFQKFGFCHVVFCALTQRRYLGIAYGCLHNCAARQRAYQQADATAPLETGFMDDHHPS